jgi:hypothetical protein
MISRISVRLLVCLCAMPAIATSPKAQGATERKAQFEALSQEMGLKLQAARICRIEKILPKSDIAAIYKYLASQDLDAFTIGQEKAALIARGLGLRAGGTECRVVADMISEAAPTYARLAVEFNKIAHVEPEAKKVEKPPSLSFSQPPTEFDRDRAHGDFTAIEKVGGASRCERAQPNLSVCFWLSMTDTRTTKFLITFDRPTNALPSVACASIAEQTKPDNARIDSATGMVASHRRSILCEVESTVAASPVSQRVPGVRIRR